jgi:16S rRNA (uracil1498-N3)-methyltransferase
VLPAAAHVFVDDLDALALRDDDEHHLFRSLRLRPGEAVTAGDGAGRWRLCRVAAGGGLEVAGDVTVEPPPAPAITIAFGIPKGDRPEWIVQKLTELGVDEIVPMTTRHTVVRWDGDKAERNLARLRDVARAAAMQSRRAWLPAVGGLGAFADVVGRAGVALAHPGGGPPALDRPVVMVGPEGGWAPEELEAAPAVVGLGPTTLRTETAALAAAVRLAALREPGPV